MHWMTPSTQLGWLEQQMAGIIYLTKLRVPRCGLIAWLRLPPSFIIHLSGRCLHQSVRPREATVIGESMCPGEVTVMTWAVCRFMSDGRELPVLWHQSLLTFVQRYKCDITQEQKEQLCELIKKHHHHEISEEVRRELENSIRRKTPMESAATK